MSNIKIRQGLSTSIYKNKYCECDGIKFQSVREMTYYISLRDRAASMQIREFKRQVKYPLLVNGVKICSYVADFVVYHFDGSFEVIDVKGVKTALYKLKKQLMLACNGIKIIEIV